MESSNRARNGSSSSAGNGAAAGGVACPEFEVIPPGGAVPIARTLPPGMVINRDHVIGFVPGAGLLALAYWLFCKCKD